MKVPAQELGRQIIELERRLDAHFAGGGAAADTVAGLAANLGRLRGDLRTVHLIAHIRTASVLSAAQRRRYQELRGYSAGRR